MISSQKQFKRLSHEVRGLYEPTEEEMARMKRLMLEIYKDVFRVCRENGLCLLLGGGSALGAVRHGGFIPWDDDMDLMMPRADYETFKRIFDEKMPKKYALQVPNAPGHAISNLYMKVILRGTERRELIKLNAPGEHGLWVDIFPVEYAPNGRAARAMKGFLSNALAYLAVSNYMRTFRTKELKAYMGKTPASRANYRLRMFLGFLTGFADYRKWYCAFDKFSRGKGPANYITIPTGIRHYAGETHPVGAFFPPQRCAFEGEEAYLPADARAYLQKLYGDYMTPPPPEKRERHFYVSLDLGAEDADGK